MTALHDFIQAAASYYGVPLEQLTEGSALDTTRGDLEVVLRVALTPDDVEGIAGRMRVMAREREAQAAEAATTQKLLSQAWAESDPGAMRARYYALAPAERSAFGSFHRFKALGGVLPEAPVVVEKAELPPHVYLSPREATEQQKAMAVGRDARGWFAVDPADLTPDQRLRHGLGGVTSNADDFGGLPG